MQRTLAVSDHAAVTERRIEEWRRDAIALIAACRRADSAWRAALFATFAAAAAFAGSCCSHSCAAATMALSGTET